MQRFDTAREPGALMSSTRRTRPQPIHLEQSFVDRTLALPVALDDRRLQHLPLRTSAGVQYLPSTLTTRSRMYRAHRALGLSIVIGYFIRASSNSTPYHFLLL